MLLVVAPTLLLTQTLQGQPSEVKSEYRRQWRRSISFVDSQIGEWKPVFEEFGVDTRVALSVVFPEMVRYTVIRDRIETAALRALYVSYGDEYADFSIGRFQMKPGFAQTVERMWSGSSLRGTCGIYFDLADAVDVRRRRIERLTDPIWQVRYLSIFMRIMYERFPQLNDIPLDEQVRFCATAYNFSPEASRENIEQRDTLVGWHTALWPLPSTHRYCYADIAQLFFEEYFEGEK